MAIILKSYKIIVILIELIVFLGNFPGGVHFGVNFDGYNHPRIPCHSDTVLLLLLSRFSRVRLCATPQTAHQPPPMHESEK